MSGLLDCISIRASLSKVVWTIAIGDMSASGGARPRSQRFLDAIRASNKRRALTRARDNLCHENEHLRQRMFGDMTPMRQDEEALMGQGGPGRPAKNKRGQRRDKILFLALQD